MLCFITNLIVFYFYFHVKGYALHWRNGRQNTLLQLCSPWHVTSPFHSQLRKDTISSLCPLFLGTRQVQGWHPEIDKLLLKHHSNKEKKVFEIQHNFITKSQCQAIAPGTFQKSRIFKPKIRPGARK